MTDEQWQRLAQARNELQQGIISDEQFIDVHLDVTREVVAAAVQAERARADALQIHLERMTDYCENWLFAQKVMTGMNDLYVLKLNIEASRAAIRARGEETK